MIWGIPDARKGAAGRAVQGYTSFPCCAPASEEAALTIPRPGGLAGASRKGEFCGDLRPCDVLYENMRRMF